MALSNDFVKKMDTFPKTVPAAFAYLKIFKGKKGATVTVPGGEEPGVACVAAGSGARSEKNTNKPVCYGCGKSGHILANCRSISEERKQTLQRERLEANKKLEAAKKERATSGTQHTAVDETPEEPAEPEGEENDGKPTYDECLIALGYQNVAVSDEVTSELSWADIT